MKRLGSISATREVEGGDGDTGRLFIGQAGRFRCLFLLFSIFLSKRVTYVNPRLLGQYVRSTAKLVATQKL